MTQTNHSTDKTNISNVYYKIEAVTPADSCVCRLAIAVETDPAYTLKPDMDFKIYSAILEMVLVINQDIHEYVVDGDVMKLLLLLEDILNVNTGTPFQIHYVTPVEISCDTGSGSISSTAGDSKLVKLSIGDNDDCSLDHINSPDKSISVMATHFDYRYTRFNRPTVHTF